MSPLLQKQVKVKAVSELRVMEKNEVAWTGMCLVNSIPSHKSFDKQFYEEFSGRIAMFRDVSKP